MSSGVRAPSNVARELAKSRLGVSAVVFFVMSAATPLTVIAGVVTTAFATTGQIALPAAFIAVAIVLALFAVGFVAMAPRITNAGAFYAYVSHGLGKPAGVGTAWVALLAYNLAQVGLYGAIGAATAPLVQAWFGVELAWWVFALVTWAIVAFLGVRQVDTNGKVLAVLLIAEVVIAVVYSAVNLAHPAGGEVSFVALSPAELFGGGVGPVLAIAVLGFVGFESAVVFSEESKDPRRTIRTATFASIGLIAVLYAVGSWALTVATGPDKIVQAAADKGPELLFTLVALHVPEWMVDLGHVLFATSVLAAMISFHNTAARYAFALGRENVLPAAFGRTSGRTGSPVTGSVVQSITALVVIVLFAVFDLDAIKYLFYLGGTAGGLGVLFLLAVTSVAIVAFFRREPSGEGVWVSLVVPVVAGVAVITVAVLAWTNVNGLLGEPEDSFMGWLVPLVFGGVAVLGAAWALVLRSTRPDTYRAIGLGAHSTAAEVNR